MENKSREGVDTKFSLLLKVRSYLKKKKPRFIRMNSWYLARLPDSWRNPDRSLDNKIRLQKKGYPAKVKIGYRGPRLVRGFHPSGKKEILITDPKDIDKVDPKLYVIRISSSVGMRKRREIIKKAAELGLKVLNAR